MIIGMPWLARHNPEVNWRTGEVKMTRCPPECGRQWRPKQGKSGWQKQKEEEAKKKQKETGRERRKTEEKQKRRKNGGCKKVKRKNGKYGTRRRKQRSRRRCKKLVPEKFHKWIKVFGKKQSERMPTRKLYDHVIDMKKGFVPRKGKVYPLSREEREEMHKFISEQLRKGYIRPSKFS